MFAQTVKFLNRRPAGQQQLARVLQIRQTQGRGRRGEQGRSAPGNQRNDQIPLPGPLGQSQDARPGVRRRLVRHRMGGLGDLHGAGRAAMPRLHHHQPGADAVAQNLFHGLGHGRARLPRADHDHPVKLGQIEFVFPQDETIPVSAQGGHDRGVGIDRSQGRVQNLHDGLARLWGC